MAGPYYTSDNYGVTKLTKSAPNFDKGDGVSPGAMSSNAAARGVGGLPGGKKIGSGAGNSLGSATSDQASASPAASPEQIANLQARADAGDPNASALLDILLASGAAGGTLLTHHLLTRNKKPGVIPSADAPGTSLVPSSPPVTRVQEEVIPRGKPEKQGYLPKQASKKIDVGGQARTGATDKKLVTEKPSNPRNLPATKQGSTDAAYSAKAAQDAKAKKNYTNVNPGRDAKKARIQEFGHILRRVIK